MTRFELEKYILEKYEASTDFPWVKYPENQVFRHKDNEKWFALIMEVSKSKLGIEGNELLDVVNLKCNPIMIGSFWNEPGIFKAYHMSKSNWLTVALDGSAEDDTLKFLLDMSFELTARKATKRGN